MLALFAQTVNPWENLGVHLVAAALFGGLGIVLLLLGFKMFERFTPKVDIEQELAKGNVAVGIMVGALLVGLALIVKMAIGG